MVNIQKNNHLSISKIRPSLDGIYNHLAYANCRNTPNSAATPNKPPIRPRLSTNYDPIITNKANLLNAQMNVSTILTKEYENQRLHGRGENKPNQTQFPQITTISLFTAVNLRKEFRRFWFRYRTTLLFYAIPLTQNAQKKLCGYHPFSYGNSTILC